MMFIHLIIFVMLFDGITTKNSSTDRFILHTSCSINKDGLKSIHPIPNIHQSEFYFSNQSPSSSFLSPSLLLSYCEYQPTTYYSSSGFAILRSSPRFLLTNVDNPQQTSSFYPHHNAILSVVDQSLSTAIPTLMSSNENNLLVDTDHNNSAATTTTSFNSLLSTTTTTTFSNVSIFHATQRETNRTFNIALLVGCISASLILIIIIIYAFIKYRNRDEGSYKIDESKNFVTSTRVNNHDNGGCGGKIASSNHQRQKLITTNEHNGVDSREWYV